MLQFCLMFETKLCELTGLDSCLYNFQFSRSHCSYKMLFFGSLNSKPLVFNPILENQDMRGGQISPPPQNPMFYVQI